MSDKDARFTYSDVVERKPVLKDVLLLKQKGGSDFCIIGRAIRANPAFWATSEDIKRSKDRYGHLFLVPFAIRGQSEAWMVASGDLFILDADDWKISILTEDEYPEPSLIPAGFKVKENI